MNTEREVKNVVKEKYGQIARGEIEVIARREPCCGDGSKGVTNVSAKYSDNDLAGLPDGADLGLGCGTPASFADMKEGMTVLDLGSGAGIDCFIAAKYVGKTGKVIGVDMTDEMIQKANDNKSKVDAGNVEFRPGEIENLPVLDGSIDRVISNCVINLVPDKAVAFNEIFRVLKPGGKFIVSDIVVNGTVSDQERKDASLWAGCVSGALDRNDYLAIIARSGFSGIRILSERAYEYKLSNATLSSITVTAEKAR